MFKKTIFFITITAVLLNTYAMIAISQDSTYSDSSTNAEEIPDFVRELMKEFFMKGHALFNEKRYDESIAEFKKVLELSPDHGESKKYIKRAESLKENGSDTLSADSHDPEVLKGECFIKGHKLFSEGRYDESITEFEKLLNIDPGHTESKKYIRRAKKELGTDTYSDSGTGSHGDTLEQHFMKGQSLFIAEDYQEATKEFKKALDINPQHDPSWEYLERCENAMRNKP